MLHTIRESLSQLRGLSSRICVSLVINSCPPQKISFESEVENVYMCVFKLFPFRERGFLRKQ